MGLESGIYTIKCAAYADRVLDVCNGFAAPNVPIIGYQWHKGENQTWEISPAYGPNEVVIKSVLGEYFLNASSERSYPLKVAVQPFYIVWNVAPVGENLFRIGYSGTLQVVSLPSEHQGAQATIQDGSFVPWQQWLFERV